MSVLQRHQDRRLDRGASEVAARLRQTDVRFFRLLDICANALGESVRATQELSERMSFHRCEIESEAGRRDGVRRS